eukprot:TRINITY_DN74853_c0_g1_i1.p1 TRINITY_DN74853_c0_g1~~TRINITY_DN74853_c0_g1_i1.p1  ORF type:complete len:617 (+),score=119.36 TRINITY_DN74853_c0_g1_i1:87-1853(+)
MPRRVLRFHHSQQQQTQEQQQRLRVEEKPQLLQDPRLADDAPGRSWRQTALSKAHQAVQAAASAAAAVLGPVGHSQVSATRCGSGAVRPRWSAGTLLGDGPGIAEHGSVTDSAAHALAEARRSPATAEPMIAQKEQPPSETEGGQQQCAVRSSGSRATPEQNQAAHRQPAERPSQATPEPAFAQIVAPVARGKRKASSEHAAPAPPAASEATSEKPAAATAAPVSAAAVAPASPRCKRLRPSIIPAAEALEKEVLGELLAGEQTSCLPFRADLQERLGCSKGRATAILRHAKARLSLGARTTHRSFSRREQYSLKAAAAAEPAAATSAPGPVPAFTPGPSAAPSRPALSGGSAPEPVAPAPSALPGPSAAAAAPPPPGAKAQARGRPPSVSPEEAARTLCEEVCERLEAAPYGTAVVLPPLRSRRGSVNKPGGAAVEDSEEPIRKRFSIGAHAAQTVQTRAHQLLLALGVCCRPVPSAPRRREYYLEDPQATIFVGREKPASKAKARKLINVRLSLAGREVALKVRDELRFAAKRRLPGLCRLEKTYKVGRAKAELIRGNAAARCSGAGLLCLEGRLPAYSLVGASRR